MARTLFSGCWRKSLVCYYVGDSYRNSGIFSHTASKRGVKAEGLKELQDSEESPHVPDHSLCLREQAP